MAEVIVPVSEGEVLASKYRVETVIGRGGMGVVVAARHIQLGQRVAIKFLTAGATEELIGRFLREARAVVRLKSEHVARVHDVGELPTGMPYMVMELLEGTDLYRLLKRRGEPLPSTEAVFYLLHVCEAMGEAHTAGIIHRDLKPANLFLVTAPDGSPSVKVLDFGISKMVSVEGEEDSGTDAMSLTRTTTVLGSPSYMAPEQMRSSRTVDARADIWSLGAILYELVTNSVPFKAATFPELVFKVVQEEAAPPSMRRAGLPPGLEAAILRCLQKDPAKRFQNVSELAAAIAPFGPADAWAMAERVARVAGTSLPPPSGPITRPVAAQASSPSLEGLVATPTETPAPAPAVVAKSEAPRADSTLRSGADARTQEPGTHKSRRITLIGVVIGAAATLGVVGVLALDRGGSNPSEPTAAQSGAPTAEAIAPASSDTAPPPAPSAAVSAVAPAVPTAAIATPPPSTATPTARPTAAPSATAVVTSVARPVPAPAATPVAPATAAPSAPRKNPLDMDIK